MVLKDFNLGEDLGGLLSAPQSAGPFLQTATRLGVIIQKAESRPKPEGEEEQFFTFQVQVARVEEPPYLGGTSS